LVRFYKDLVAMRAEESMLGLIVRLFNELVDISDRRVECRPVSEGGPGGGAGWVCKNANGSTWCSALDILLLRDYKNGRTMSAMAGLIAAEHVGLYRLEKEFYMPPALVSVVRAYVNPVYYEPLETWSEPLREFLYRRNLLGKFKVPVIGPADPTESEWEIAGDLPQYDTPEQDRMLSQAAASIRKHKNKYWKDEEKKFNERLREFFKLVDEKRRKTLA